MILLLTVNYSGEENGMTHKIYNPAHLDEEEEKEIKSAANRE
jgi:hypothetical protein